MSRYEPPYKNLELYAPDGQVHMTNMDVNAFTQELWRSFRCAPGGGGLLHKAWVVTM